MEKLFNKIICPVDFSDFSASALKKSAALTAAMGSELHVAHIIINPLSKMYGDNIANKVANTGIEQIVKEKMKKFLADQSLGLPYNIFIKQVNHVYQGIIEYVEEQKADLIVMSALGRTGLKKFLMGSATEAIIRRAPCSVLLVRT